MATQAERTAATRGRILDAARWLFAEQGYDDTTVSDLLEAAGISKGALYHHFESKDAVAETLFGEVSRGAILGASRRGAETDDPLEALVEAALHWIDEVSEPSVAAVMFVLGPTALGWERCREIENATSLRVLRLGLGRAVEAGRFPGRHVEVAAHTINAMLAELAWLTVHPDEASVEQTDVAAVVRATVHALAEIDT